MNPSPSLPFSFSDCGYQAIMASVSSHYSLRTITSLYVLCSSVGQSHWISTLAAEFVYSFPADLGTYGNCQSPHERPLPESCVLTLYQGGIGGWSLRSSIPDEKHQCRTSAKQPSEPNNLLKWPYSMTKRSSFLRHKSVFKHERKASVPGVAEWRNQQHDQQGRPFDKNQHLPLTSSLE